MGSEKNAKLNSMQTENRRCHQLHLSCAYPQRLQSLKLHLFPSNLALQLLLQNPRQNYCKSPQSPTRKVNLRKSDRLPQGQVDNRQHRLGARIHSFLQENKNTWNGSKARYGKRL